MFSRARAVGSVGGVVVRLDPSLLLLGVLVVVTFVGRFAGGRSLAVAVLMSVVTAVLFLLSVLGHELAHALEGMHRGVHVRSITLFALGGVTEMELDTQKARDEFAISAVGPWSSLVIAAFLGLVAEVAGRLGASAVADVAGLMAWTNLGLALFNLVPGAPLDGGRVLRSLAWAVTGNRDLAAVVAVRVGQLVGVGLAVLGAAAVVDGRGIVGPLWLVVLGAFIVHAATREHAANRVERRLSGHTAAGLAPPATTLPADMPVATAVDATATLPADELVVVEGGGAPAAVEVATLRAVAAPDAAHRTVGDLASPASPAEVAADASARELARTVDEHGLVRIGPSQDGAPATLVTRRGVDTALRSLLDDGRSA